MFITPAWAQEAAETASDTAEAAAGSPGILVTMLPLVLIFFVFYLMVIRPQNKRIIDHRKMMENLQKNDKVVTGGGLVATVKKVINDEEVLLDLGHGVEVVAIRQTIMTVKESHYRKSEEQKAAVEEAQRAAKEAAKKASQ
ncbi:MAG TPA: preprotein translocase subunit YajC [Patescibacteria group bacterium]|nr:preprotein translocase subunit YajC [Patescibacteria group bacterium]